jgi:hypothetical protein
MRALNLALRFALEMCALVALGYGGWHTPFPGWARLLLAVGLPLAAVVLWGRWVAPKASHPVHDPLRLIPEWVVFGGATIALFGTGHPVLGALLAILAAVNRLVLHLLGTTTRRERVTTGGDPTAIGEDNTATGHSPG